MSNRIKTHIGEGVQVSVEFDYQPSERETLEDPGCDESVELCSVKILGNVYNPPELLPLLRESCIADLETKALESMGDQA